MAEDNKEKRQELVYMAKVCEQTERFQDMLKYMKQILEFGEDLSVEDRNLLSVAYKNSVGSLRTSWRILDTLEKKENAKSSTPETEKHLQLIKDFKKKVEVELDSICNEIIDLLGKKLIPNSSEFTSKVFYLKMKGDYYRYIAEYSSGSDRDEVAKLADESYKAAEEIAKEKMDTTDPIRLGLALNYSVFHYEIKNDAKQACNLAKTAFDDAIADIETIQDENYKDSTTIMQLMRDNLTLWTSELEEGDDENQDD